MSALTQKRVTTLLLLAICVASASAIDLMTQTLDTSAWKFREAGDASWYPATVPGTVHTDLMANKVIEDPYYRANWLDVQWVEEKDWEYYCIFDVSDKTLLDKKVQELVFDGLDTHAEVYLNGDLVLTANNMFRTWRVDVSDQLQQTGNTLNIIFQSAVNHDNLMAAQIYPTILPADNTRVFSRKAQYQYGWDWGPRLVTAGIWKSLRLEAFDTWQFMNVNVIQDKLVIGKVSDIRLRFDARVYNPKELKESVVKYTVKDDLGVVAASGEQFFGPWSTDEDKLYENTFTTNVTINNPKLWWTREIGSQHMYTVEATYTIGDDIVSTVSSQFGIRSIEWVQEDGSFYMKLNERPIFMRGGNYIPPDMFMPRVTADTYKDIVGAAAEANYNMLRVWGGGNWENDAFYEECDKQGILIWHDLMFACGMYPGDDDFIDNVNAELTDNISRIRNHPSIALWVGNNEIQTGWEDWGWKDQLTADQQDLVYGWYQALFLDQIPATLSDVDHRTYWPSSPSFGYTHPESSTQGDTHYWGVWAGKLPIETFSTYKSRFVSEYGMQSMPNMNTIKEFTVAADWSITSAVMLAHERHASHYDTFNMYMADYFAPTDTFEDLVHASQILQQYAMKTAIEAHLRLMPVNMGTLTWQINDVWPVVSWSTRDYYGNWKATQYTQKKLYQKAILTAFYTAGTSLDLYTVSHYNYDFTGIATLNVVDLSGNKLVEVTQTVTVPKETAGKVISIPVSQLAAVDITNAIIYSKLDANAGKTEFENINYFGKPKDLKLQNPALTMKLTDAAHNCMTVTGTSYAMGVYVYADGTFTHFDENYFDLLPGVPATICMPSGGLATIFPTLKVISLYDTIKQAPVIDEEILAVRDW